MDQSPPPAGMPQSPVRPEVVYEPAPRKKSSLLSRIFWGIVLMGLLGSVALNLLLFVTVAMLGFGMDEEGRVREQFVSGDRFAADKVAIFSIEGTILSGEGFFRHQIEHARKDIEAGNLKAIVLRVNSPGGTISGSDYMLHHLRELAKLRTKPTPGVKSRPIPIVVSMGGLAASGGYYVSMCVGDTEDSIFAEPTTWTGSIGVLLPHYNLVELMGKLGVADDTIATNPLKTIGSFARKMTPKEREILQALVDDSFAQFKAVIKQGRPRFQRDPEALDKLATGQIYSANQALTNGLVDQIGFVEDALDRAMQMAGLDKAKVKVVKYRAEPRLAEILFGQSQFRAPHDLAALLEATTPRAYYLCTSLPILAGSKQ
jgi:protease IV